VNNCEASSPVADSVVCYIFTWPLTDCLQYEMARLLKAVWQSGLTLKHWITVAHFKSTLVFHFFMNYLSLWKENCRICFTLQCIQFASYLFTIIANGHGQWKYISNCAQTYYLFQLPLLQTEHHFMIPFPLPISRLTTPASNQKTTTKTILKTSFLARFSSYRRLLNVTSSIQLYHLIY